MKPWLVTSPSLPPLLGGVGMMCPLSEEGKQLAIEVSNILGMDVCGIDLLQMNDGSFVVCEANANVGFIAFDQACGMDVAGIVADFALSMLPSRLTRKMSLLSVVSSTSETSSEPEVCPVPAGGGSLPEAVCNMSVGSTSSESDPELAEPSQSSPRQSTGPTLADLPGLPDPAYNFNTLLANEIKLLTEWDSSGFMHTPTPQIHIQNTHTHACMHGNRHSLTHIGPKKVSKHGMLTANLEHNKTEHAFRRNKRNTNKPKHEPSPANSLQEKQRSEAAPLTLLSVHLYSQTATPTKQT